MNPISTVYQNPLIPEADYWVRLAGIEYLVQKPSDVADGWVATLVIERLHPEQHGTTLRVAVHGTQNATAFRQSFRDYFRCFGYAPHLAIGRWARVQVVPDEFNGNTFSRVLFPQLSSGVLSRMVHEAAEFERQTGTVSHQPRSLNLLSLHRETLVAIETEQPPVNAQQTAFAPDEALASKSRTASPLPLAPDLTFIQLFQGCVGVKQS